MKLKSARFTIGAASGVTNPTGAYPKTTPGSLIEACGLIPHFVSHVVEHVLDKQATAKEFAEAVDNLYGYGGLDYPFDGTIDDYGNYVTKEDPKLKPYVRMTNLGVDVYIYPYAIVGFVDSDDNQIIFRMD